MIFLKISGVILIGASCLLSLNASQRLDQNEWPKPGEHSSLKNKKKRHKIRVNKQRKASSSTTPLASQAVQKDEGGKIVKYSALLACQAELGQVPSTIVQADKITMMEIHTDLLTQLIAMKNSSNPVPCARAFDMTIPLSNSSIPAAVLSNTVTTDKAVKILNPFSQPFPLLLLPPVAEPAQTVAKDTPEKRPQTPVRIEQTVLTALPESLSDFTSKNQPIELVSTTPVVPTAFTPVLTPEVKNLEKTLAPSITSDAPVKNERAQNTKNPPVADEDDDIVFIQKDPTGKLVYND